MIYDVFVSTTVRVTINNDDVIERITGPRGDEWRAAFYPLHTRDDVINHLAFNAITNGVTRARTLEGWADLADDAATMDVTETDPEAVMIVKEGQ
jgi:hypothetical protein